MHSKELRHALVDKYIASSGITNHDLLNAMRTVPRHRFVPHSLIDSAYDDIPLPIGEGQTISQPYLVACMTQAVGVVSGSKVLEIGTGSGYQAAILAEMGCHVYTIERIPSLAEDAKEVLRNLGYKSVQVKVGDGSMGWNEHAPYDVIIVTAGAPIVPEACIEQLAPNGKMVIPVGNKSLQQLICVTKREDGSIEENVLEYVRFVPLIGDQGW